MADLSTIIVNYNTRADLVNCLASLEACPPRGTHEVIVVDNASSDGSVAAIRDRFPHVRIIEPGRNLGFGAANNLGFKVASSDLCLLLNSDTLVPAGALETLVDDFRSRQDVAAAGPRIVDGEGRAELSFGRMMGPWNELRQKTIVRLCERGFGPAVAWVESTTRVASYPDWVSGACLLVRKADAAAVQFFDERYFLYAEDVDFCASLRGLGKKIRFFPGCQIVHLRGRSGRGQPGATRRAYRQSQVRFYDKHHPGWARLLKAYLRVRGQWPGAGA